MQSITTHTRTYLMLLIAAVMIGSSFIVFYFGYREQIEINYTIYREEERKERIYQLQAFINRAGMEARDYVLTGSEPSMQAAHQSMDQADSVLSQLRKDYPDQVSYSLLEKMVERGKFELTRIESTYKEKGIAAATQIYEEPDFRAFRNNINKTVQTLKQEAADHFVHLLNEAKIIRARNLTGFLLLFLVSVCILLMVWLYFRSTERRLAMKRAMLLQNIERQERAEQLLQGGYFEWYPEQNQLIWSRGILSIFELPDGSSVLDLDWALDRIIDAGDREMVRQWILGQGSSRLSLQMKVLTANGTEKILQMEGYSTSVADGGKTPKRRGVVQDVTHWVMTEKENLQLAGIIENSLNEVYIFDEQTLLFEYVNKGALQNLGFSRAEMRRMTPLDIKPEFEFEQFNKLLNPLRGDEEEKVLFNTIHQRKDGSTYHVEVHVQLTNFRNKKVFTAIIIDVSESVESARKLKEANDNLQRRNRELNQFASVTAHDLQEPLRMVRSFTTLLQNKYAGVLDEKARDYIHYAADGARRMQVLINDILEYSRAGGKTYEMSQIDMDQLIATIRHDMQMSIGKSGGSLNCGEMKGVLVWGNQNWLYRLFMNLISNGLKFCKPDEPPCLTVTVEDIGLQFRFCIEDNGIGIPAEAVDQLFLPYHRLHSREKYEGTGLGLAICKKIVDQHQGKIWVESDEGIGTRFYIELKKQNA